MKGKINRKIYEITLVCDECMTSNRYGVNIDEVKPIHCTNPECPTNLDDEGQKTEETPAFSVEDINTVIGG